MKKVLVLISIIFLYACNPSGNDAKKSEQNTAPEIKSTHVKKPVNIKSLEPEAFYSFFNATGTIEAVEDAMISPEVNGQISLINVKQGDKVEVNDLLIKLNTEMTQRNINEVKTNLELANNIFKRQKQLWEKEIGSEVQFLEAKNRKESLEARLKTLQSQLEKSYIKAPYSGVIDNILVKTGELASPGKPLIRLVNLDKMKITAMISESFLGTVDIGDTVQISFANYSDWSIKRPISRIGTVIDPITRTFEIEVLLDNPEQKLRPNMLSSLRIQDYADTSALLVPSIILKEDFQGIFLFKAVENGDDYIAKKQYVKPGKTVQDVTKITEGVQPGDNIITQGYNMVSNGESIKITNL
ncbi:MAG TPA: efflux RND transporter periplasmic adaptor subunit [Bacteroidales bacterium]|nr:efflux RND transporter periplasmic adaptor subunit [Bacteroidales bacterium]